MSYPDAFPKDAFTVHTIITHDPTGLKFAQAGGRISVLAAGEDGIYRLHDSFTNSDLQEFGVVLTKGKLMRAAIRWLQAHPRK